MADDRGSMHRYTLRLRCCGVSEVWLRVSAPTLDHYQQHQAKTIAVFEIIIVIILIITIIIFVTAIIVAMITVILVLILIIFITATR